MARAEIGATPQNVSDMGGVPDAFANTLLSVHTILRESIRPAPMPFGHRITLAAVVDLSRGCHAHIGLPYISLSDIHEVRQAFSTGRPERESVKHYPQSCLGTPSTVTRAGRIPTNGSSAISAIQATRNDGWKVAGVNFRRRSKEFSGHFTWHRYISGWCSGVAQR